MNILTQKPQQVQWSIGMEKQSLWVDVRSEKEYAQGSIPNAKLVSLFNNDERATIGTLYKNYGSQAAIQRGYELVHPKIEHFHQQFEKIWNLAEQSQKQLVIFCARGGMRSRAICSLLNTWGFQAFQLQGGYKIYRQSLAHFFQTLHFPGGLWLLHGKTGSGKTQILQNFPNSIDLEGLAQHRGSLFGGLGLQKTTQKWFEARLAERIGQINLQKPVLMEGESSKIGSIYIVKPLWKMMQEAKKINIFASKAERIKRILEVYKTEWKEQEILNILKQLIPLFGKEKVQKATEFFQAKNYPQFVEFLLTEYYDPKYAHGQKKLTFTQEWEAEDLNHVQQQIAFFLNSCS